MYLTDFREYSLKDVITQFEPGLFKKVTGLAVKDFELLVSLGLFNDELMNDAVYNFKRYEDSSLEYSGLKMHSDDEDVGLFSTVISRDDYEQMAKQQGSSMDLPFTAPVVTPPPAPSPKIASFTPKKKDAVAGITALKPTKPYILDSATKIGLVAEDGLRYGSYSKDKPAPSEIPEVRVGDKVLHKKFGDGEIISVENDKFSVRFGSAVKTLSIQISFTNGIVRMKGDD